jgi:hypothetical protein
MRKALIAEDTGLSQGISTRALSNPILEPTSLGTGETVAKFSRDSELEEDHPAR